MDSGRSDGRRRAAHPARAQDPGRRAVSASARPRWSARSARSGRCRPRSCSPTPASAPTTSPGSRRKRTTTVAMDFGRITISDDLVLYLFGTPGPGPVLVPLGRAGARRAGRGRAGRHPAAGRLLPVDRLLRAARHAVRRGGQLLRRRAAVRRRTRSATRSTWTRTCRWCSATRGTASPARRCWSRWSSTWPAGASVAGPARPRLLRRLAVPSLRAPRRTSGD